MKGRMPARYSKKNMRNYFKLLKQKNRFQKDIQIYNSCKKIGEEFDIQDQKLCFYEDENEAGALDQHYFLQDIWMAQEIAKHNAEEHYDVGSRIDGFISHLLVLKRKVTLIDIRPLEIEIANLRFIQEDAMSLGNLQTASIESLSSLHAIEHFGLGRYGDPIFPDAWRMALQSMERVIKPEGYLYISVPIGKKDVLVFNAHRIFRPQTIIDNLPQMKLQKFMYIKNYKIYEVPKEEIDLLNICEDYLCGCFVFRK